MKKHSTGFVPVNFYAMGKTMLAIGVICILAKGIDALTGIFNFPNIALYFGLALLVLGAYLTLVVPKDN